MVDTAREKANRILKEHEPAPLDETVAEALREVIKEARRDFGLD